MPATHILILLACLCLFRVFCLVRCLLLTFMHHGLPYLSPQFLLRGQTTCMGSLVCFMPACGLHSGQMVSRIAKMTDAFANSRYAFKKFCFPVCGQSDPISEFPGNVMHVQQFRPKLRKTLHVLRENGWAKVGCYA